MRGIKVFKRTNKKGVYCTGGMGGSQYTEFEVGKTYELDKEPISCKQGFHFFKYDNFCFGYDYFRAGDKDTIYCEIEATGDIVNNTHKCVTNKIKIVRKIPKKEWSKWLDEDYNSGSCNSGHRNSGHRNSGDYNSGDYNSGDYNSGDYNSGHRNSGSWNSGHRNSGKCNLGHRNSGDYNSRDYNSGDYNSGSCNSGHRNSGHRNSGDYNSGDYNSGSWNSCNRETGFFNSKQSEYINIFNKPCHIEVWERAKKPNFIYFETSDNKSYKKSFIKSFKTAKNELNWKEQLELLENLPNFNWEVFEEISGISKEMAYGE